MACSAEQAMLVLVPPEWVGGANGKRQASADAWRFSVGHLGLEPRTSRL